MFEGYSSNKYTSTGVIQWMLNNAWPEMIWHLYDYYLNTGGSYFGAKKACEDMHIQYNYNDSTIWIVNSLYTTQSNFLATVKVVNFDATVMLEKNISIGTVLPDSSQSIMALPSIGGLSSTYFLKLSLSNTTSVVSDNFYWLSTSEDVLDWAASNFYRTPCSSYADFTLLQHLPPVVLDVKNNVTTSGNDTIIAVQVQNPTKAIAFFVRLRITQGVNGEDVLPTLWDDNYFSLLPNESKQVTARFSTAALGNKEAVVVPEVFNSIRYFLNPYYLFFYNQRY